MSFEQASVKSSLVSTAYSGTSVSVATELFDEFNKKPKNSEQKSNKLLNVDGITSTYKQLRLGIIKDTQLTEESIAATVIQRAYIKYRTKKRFVNFLRTYKRIHNRTYSPFFYNFALNGTKNQERRLRYFNLINRRLLWGRKLTDQYINLTWEQYNITGLFMVFHEISPENLCLFVKKVYAHDMRRILFEWLITVKKIKKQRKLLQNFQNSKMLHFKFNEIYVPFKLWQKKTWCKYHRELTLPPCPEFDNYERSLKQREKIIKKANVKFLSTLKKRVISALKTNFIEKNADKQILEEADAYAKRSTHQYALKAWIKTVSKKKEKFNSLMYALTKWKNYYEAKKHTRFLVDTYHRRSDSYRKLRVLNCLAKNMKKNKILEANAYIKIQAKPSLALFLAHTLKKDEVCAALALSMHAWVQYTRRRRNWQYFISGNITESNHNHLKSKALCALRKRKYISKGYGFIQPYFKHTTYQLYQRVMDSREEERDPTLIVEGDVADEISKLLENTKTNRDKREAFFQAWQLIPQDPSLLMRVAILNLSRERSNEMSRSLDESQRKKTNFQRAVANFKSLNLASPEKFKIVLSSIKENYARALKNRTKTTIRDSIIIAAHQSHASALEMRSINPTFKTVESVRIAGKVRQAAENLEKNFVPLINIVTLGVGLKSINTDDFEKFTRMKIHSRKFTKELIDLKNIILVERKRSEFNMEMTQRFDRLLFGGERDSVQKNYRTETTIDAFSEKNLKKRPAEPNKDGIQPKYLGFFKPNVHEIKRRDNESNTRKRQISKEDNISLTEADAERLRLSGLDSKSQLSLEVGTKSSFFNKLDSFVSMMKETASKMKNNTLITPGQSISEFPDIQESEESPEIGEEEMFSDTSSEQEPEEETQKKVNEVKSRLSESGAINDGFDNTIMHSAIDTSDIKDPEVNQKYKQFLEILFGKQGKDQPTTQQLNAIKKKIVAEYKNRKIGAPGISTHGITLPVTSLVEEYRSDRKKSKETETEATLNRVRKNEKLVKEEEEKEYQCKYNSRRYFPGQMEAEHEEEEEKVHSFREDLMEMTRQNEIPEESDDEEEEKNGAQINDNDFDAAADQEKPQEEADSYVPGLEIKIPKQVDTKDKEKKPFVDNGLAMKSINKVVFNMISRLVRSEDSNFQLVETEGDQLPELDLSKLHPADSSQSRETIKKTVTAMRSKRKTIRQLPQKSGKPTVIPQITTISPGMAEIMREDESYNRTIYDNGQVTLKPGHFQPVPQPKQKKIHFTGTMPTYTNHFVEGQVVSFASGARGINQKPTNFTNIHINATKQRGITRPIIAPSPSSAHKPSTPQQKKRDPLGPVYGTLIDLTEVLDKKDNTKFKKFAARVKSMKARSALAPVPDKSHNEIIQPQFQQKIQSIYVKLTTEQNVDKAQEDLIDIAYEKPAFLRVLQRAVSQVVVSKKKYIEEEEKRRRKEQPKVFNKELVSKFVDLSWMKIDPNYKAVALQFAEDKDKNLEAIVAPTYEEPAPVKQRRAKTAASNQRSWDEVIRSYDLNEMMLVTPCVPK